VFDRVHLQQVLWNLLRNAWRHSRQRAASVRVEVRRQANRVELHVIDDGEGVPTHLRQQLFEPFFTTYSGGTGLGLYIAREMCAANGAILEYAEQAARGGGADFRMLCGGRPA
jgi:two-component system sensor histidine kinase PilS (NtrC family)